MNKITRNKKIILFTLCLWILSNALFAILVYSTQNSTSATYPVNPPNVLSSSAIMYVNPNVSIGTIGQTFTLNITISDVVNLYGWEFKLSWNSSILEVLNVTEGDFLKKGGDTFFIKKIYNTEGYILAACTLLGKIPGVNGTGTLATIEFYVEGYGESVLHLYDTKLGDPSKQPISHTTIDGYYRTAVHDVAVIDLVASKTTVQITVENQGTESETFSVSAYYRFLTDPLIGNQSITLASGTNTTLTFTWAPPAYGRYEIRAEASIVPGEVDIADNTRTIIIHVGYGEPNPGSIMGESINGLHIAGFTFAMLASVMVLAFRKNKEMSLSDMSASILKQNLRNNLFNNKTNIWNDWTRRQPL